MRSLSTISAAVFLTLNGAFYDSVVFTRHQDRPVSADHSAYQGDSLASAVSPQGTLPIPSLFNTGTGKSGALENDTFADTHYSLIASPDVSFPLGDAIVVNQAFSPVPPACSGPCWLPTEAASKWVAPRAAASFGNAAGTYIYRTAFDLTGFDPNTAAITGEWSADDFGLDIHINGVSTGFSFAETDAFTRFHPFAMTSGFIAGVNTFDFVVQNVGGATGLRVEMNGTAQPVTLPAPGALESAIIPVQPSASWEARSGPENPPGCINPTMTGIIDVNTPAGPGIQADAMGSTLACCGCATAKRRFQSSRAWSSLGATISFYYETGISGQFSGTSYILDLRHQDASVGTVSLLGLLGPVGVSNCNVTQGTSPNQQSVLINLGSFLGNVVVFDRIDVTLQNYGCVSTNRQIISDLTLRAGVFTARPTIISVAIAGPKIVQITGTAFGQSPRVMINVADVSGFISDNGDTFIVLRGKRKKLGLVSGDNTIQVIDASGSRSNAFVLSL